MNCEICGSSVGPFYQAIFLGDRVIACSRCVKKHNLTVIKKSVSTLNRTPSTQIIKRKRIVSKQSFRDLDEYELIPDYGVVIRRARERMGWTQEDLAKMLRVKLSYIKKVEANKLIPEPHIMRKIEKLLNVKLTMSEEELSKEVFIEEEVDEYTLGDLIRGYGEEVDEGDV